MVKQWGFSILALGIVFLYTGWSHLSAAQQTVNVHPLVQTLQKNNWQLETWMVHHGSPLNRPLTERQTDHLIRYFQLQERETDSPFQAAPRSIQSEDVYFSDGWRNIPLEIRVIRRGNEKAASGDYLVVQVQADGRSSDSLLEAVQYVSEGLAEAGIHPDIQVSIQGSTLRMLNRDEQEQFIHRTLRHLDAYEVEALRDATSTSVSAFSPHLGQPIMSNGREMNVQIALRNDKVHQRTIMTMGTPIITIEY